jgi:hypothetical protein
MAPRANWKGFLRLSLVTCPVALYPATSDSEKISFNQINRNTGHRIKYLKVDADTGEEVASDEIMKGYKVGTDTYIEITQDEGNTPCCESPFLPCRRAPSSAPRRLCHTPRSRSYPGRRLARPLVRLPAAPA